MQENFATLISILDGQGFTSDSGTRGKRGYEEAILFNWLGPTTPVPAKTHRMMSQLGTRLLFPDIWNDLLECADPDVPHVMYFAFADLLLQHRENENLWSRAYRFFDEIAERGNPSSHDLLGEAFDRLWDSDKREEVEEHLGSAARTIFQRSKP